MPLSVRNDIKRVRPITLRDVNGHTRTGTFRVLSLRVTQEIRRIIHPVLRSSRKAKREREVYDKHAKGKQPSNCAHTYICIYVMI